MQFNFSCWALCAIEVERDEDDPRWRGCAAKILGFWLTQEDALTARILLETKALAQHEARYKVVNGRWPAYPWDDPGYTPGVYVSVPLSAMRFDDLTDATEMIERAAVLSYWGCGVSA
jgi:hypothetical protein